MIIVSVPGQPATKSRARVGRGHAYTPQRTKEAEELVGWCLRRAIPKPFSEPLHVTLEFHTRNLRIDVDNAAKLVLDAGNRIAWTDDKIIWKLDLERVYTNDVKTVIRI